MINIRDLREHPEVYKESAKQRGISIDIDALLAVDKQRAEQLGRVEELRAGLNVKGKPTAEQLAELQSKKKELEQADAEFRVLDEKYSDLVGRVPNILAEGTPEGGEEANRQERTWGEAVKGDVKDHVTIAEANGWLDFERGTKVAGSKFYFLKGALVKLELAMTRMIFDKLEAAGFTVMEVPHMVTTRIASGTGFLPRGEERQIYKIEGEDLNLIATAEMPLTGYYADEILAPEQLPAVFAGLSPSYRMEAGAYGKYSKGLYRVHQFNKLEMYVFCLPNASAEWHDKLVQIEEDIVKALEIPYRVVRIAAGDLGAPAYKKYDVEYWSPVEGEYRELMSCSNVTDYQARRLNIRYRGADGKPEFVHTLNGTAAAFSRMPIAFLENHQQPDGSIRVPAALQTYYGGATL